jgi:hypothetical protein
VFYYKLRACKIISDYIFNCACMPCKIYILHETSDINSVYLNSLKTCNFVLKIRIIISQIKKPIAMYELERAYGNDRMN